jgi:hypothetical protein
LNIVACFICLWLVVSPAVGAGVRGREAKVVSVNDTGHLHLIGRSGPGESRLIEIGRATGTLPGTVRATLSFSGNIVPIQITVYLHGGSISAQGTAKLGSEQREYVSFSGSLTITHGSGRYAHASGTGRLYGTVDRHKNNAVVAQVIGRLRF